jgi:xyloglucan fucosyltransferase
VCSTIWVTIFATPQIRSGRGLITRFYQAYLAKADDRIGLQIRVFHDKTTPIFETVIDQILACVLKEKLLPEAVDTQEPIPSPSRNQTSKAIL